MKVSYPICSSNPVAHAESRSPRQGSYRGDYGIALVTTLLVLALMTVMSLGIVIALTSQTLIGGFYRNFRGSFYAADSGLNIARQQMVNQLTAAVPAAFAIPPITNAGLLATNIRASLATSYGSSSALNGGAGANAWKESFTIPAGAAGATLTLAPGSPVPQAPFITNTATCTLAAPCPSGYQYTYNYTLTSVGSAQGSERATVTENGSITMNVTGLQANNSVSFAYFGGFVDKYPACIGPLVPGTMTGPMFTNDSWEFMASIPPYTSPYIFTDPVGQQSGTAYWWDSGWGCHADTTPGPWGSGNSLVNPSFQAGFQMGQPAVALPTNSFNQEWAVLDGRGTGEGPAAPTAAQLSTSLENVHGAAYTSGATSGVFVDDPGTSATCGTVAPPCVKGGGFYVEGDAQILLQPSGSTAQIYQITQGGTTTTITIDPAANGGAGTTVIAQAGTTLTLNGVPMNGITGLPSTMVYVDGNITGLTGPGEGQGAIQDNAMITLTAAGSVTATGDVLYKTEPVTYTQNQIVPGSNPPCCSGTPMDTLIPGVQNMNQVLGIYTATGNFVLANTQGDQNIQIDGSIATLSQQDSSNCNGGDGGFLNTGGHINAFNNVGGQIQSCIYGADINVENIWFDRRFTARAGFAPPWFPSTSIQQGGPLPSNVTTKVQRVQWLNTSAE